MSHSAEVQYDYAKDYPKWFDWWLRQITDMIKEHYDYFCRHIFQEKRNPVHFCRFEDLCDDVCGEISSMMKFSLDLTDLEGTNMQRRIE